MAVLRNGCSRQRQFCSLITDRTVRIVNPERSHGSCDVEKQLAQDSDSVFTCFHLAFVFGASEAELQRQGSSGVKAGVVDSFGDGEVTETSICLADRF